MFDMSWMLHLMQMALMLLFNMSAVCLFVKVREWVEKFGQRRGIIRHIFRTVHYIYLLFRNKELSHVKNLGITRSMSRYYHAKPVSATEFSMSWKQLSSLNCMKKIMCHVAH
jgi:hypothetical protein